MRLPHRRTLLVFALLAALAAPAYARADASQGPKVESSLAEAVDADQAAGGTGKLHVFVFGSGLDAVNTDLGIQPRNSLDVVGGESVTVSSDQVAKLAAQGGVAYLTLDRPVTPTDAPGSTGPAAVSAASLATLYPTLDGAAGLWASGDTGAGVGIAIVDSGVTPRADFGTRLVQVQLPTQDGTKLDDQVGHGSFVAGVAAGASPDGKYVGIAPGATVYAVNVARQDGVYTSDVVAGLKWVLDHAKADDIRVVNLSLSETAPSLSTASTLDTAVEQLWRAGIVVVASAGNLGPDSMLYAPGNDPFAITVGASDPNDTAATADDTLASFSSYGTTQTGYVKPDVVAPGRHIVSVIPPGSALAGLAPAANVVDDGAAGLYLRMNGTSFSAPQVTGAVALLLQEDPGLTPDQVKWILEQSARPLQGSTAGALDLSGTAALLASPGSANQGVPYSGWATPGNGTVVFAAAVSAALRAAAWEKAAAVWTRNANAVCAIASTSTAKPKLVQELWVRCAMFWERAADAWDNAALAWGDVPSATQAATDATSGSAAWAHAADAWTSALSPGRAGDASQRSATDQTLAAGWEKAAGWEAAGWEAAGWQAAGWQVAAGWQAAAFWD